MAAEIYTVQGERSTLGIGKESSFGVLATPTIWHAFQQLSAKPQITAVPLTGARGSLGQKYSGTGGRSFSGSLDVDGEVDTIGQLFAYALGGQTEPTHTIVSTTLTATANTGSTSFSVASSTNIFPGEVLTFGAEALTVATVQGLTVTTTGASAAIHNSGVSVTLTGTLAYASTMTMATLPTFSMEINRAAAAAGSSFLCDDFLGSKIDGMSLAVSAKKGLVPKFNFVSKQMVVNGSPTSASISTKYPIMFEQQFAAPLWNSSALSVGTESTVLSASISVSNNLLKDYFGLGAGNTVRSFPEQKRKVTGSVSLGFESTTAHAAFQAAVNGGAQPSISLTIPLYGTDIIDAALGIPYANTLYIPNAFVTGWDPSDKSSGAQMQNITFEAAESSAGAQDDLKIFHIGTASAAY